MTIQLSPPSIRIESTIGSRSRVDRAPLPVVIHAHGARAYPNPLGLSDGNSVVGAGTDADLVIDSSSVSRRHAELRLVPEGVLVVDLDSKNGSFYMGQRFERMILQPGQRFRVGSVELEIRVDQAALALDEAPGMDHYADLIGASASMGRLFDRLVRLEGSKVNVLIVGETGTGKELIARAIHQHSLVRHGPLVTVNCGALDRNLVRSELFGHERGSFTGATHSHVGAFQAANGGTLFLDEIGELPLDVQPLLLRALESRRVTPVGSHDERPVDLRLLAATHRDLAEEVRKGSFRQDLFYRLRVVHLEVPPLRERAEDIPLLARAVARRQGASLPDDFVAALALHRWPGNVRELINAVEAFLAVGEQPERSGTEAMRGALAGFITPERSYAEQKDELVRHFTHAYLEWLLRETDGNQSQAARISGLDRSYIGRLITKLGLDGKRRRG